MKYDLNLKYISTPMLVNFVNTCNQAVIEVTQKADMELRCTLNM